MISVEDGLIRLIGTGKFTTAHLTGQRLASEAMQALKKANVASSPVADRVHMTMETGGRGMSLYDVAKRLEALLALPEMRRFATDKQNKYFAMGKRLPDLKKLQADLSRDYPERSCAADIELLIDVLKLPPRMPCLCFLESEWHFAKHITNLAGLSQDDPKEWTTEVRSQIFRLILGKNKDLAAAWRDAAAKAASLQERTWWLRRAHAVAPLSGEPITPLPVDKSIKETSVPAAKTSSPVRKIDAKLLLNGIRAATPQIKSRLERLYELSSRIFDAAARGALGNDLKPAIENVSRLIYETVDWLRLPQDNPELNPVLRYSLTAGGDAAGGDLINKVLTPMNGVMQVPDEKWARPILDDAISSGRKIVSAMENLTEETLYLKVSSDGNIYIDFAVLLKEASLPVEELKVLTLEDFRNVLDQINPWGGRIIIPNGEDWLAREIHEMAFLLSDRIFA